MVVGEKQEALPDWLMRREKLRIAASLGRSGTHRTSSTAPFLARSFLALLAFDDANEYLKVQPIRQCFTPARFCAKAPDGILFG